MSSNLSKIAEHLTNKYKEYLTGIITIHDVDIYLIVQNTLPEYRLFLFNEFCSQLDMKDFCLGLKYAYTKTSGINTPDSKLSLDKIISIFEKADKKELMGIDYKKWLKLPEEITIYRGTSTKKINEAISWTTDRKRAIWFYKKYDSQGTVLKAKIKKQDVICYLDKSACNEKEVIINYKNIYSVEKLPQEELDREYNFDCYITGNVNNDYAIAATKSVLENLLAVGVFPTTELAEEILKIYQTAGNYKSKYILTFPTGEKISLYKLLELSEKR